MLNLGGRGNGFRADSAPAVGAPPTLPTPVDELTQFSPFEFKLH
jgi:hypothetical protein